jgi:hypothetical protein
MDATTSESRDRLRQAIVDEIDSLKASIRALQYRQNELAPISRLPFDVLAHIFSLLSIIAWNKLSGPMSWICVTHVCRRWRETALNHPRRWSHVNLTELTPAGMVEILARAKMVPLYLDAKTYGWDKEHLEIFGAHLNGHLSHTRHLQFIGDRLSTVVDRLVSPTPALKSLSLTHIYPGLRSIIPDNLFDRTAPSLTSLKLNKITISWKSPLLKGLRILEILEPIAEARPELDVWLDALNEMPRLKELSLQSATPVAPRSTHPLISRTVSLHSLTHFTIGASAKDCALALAHLVLPALTRLHIHVKSHDQGGEDVLLLIPYVAQYVCVLHEIEPNRSIHIGGERRCTEVLTWTAPGADVNVMRRGMVDPLDDTSRSACFLFAAKNYGWNIGVFAAILDALLTILPMNSVSTLTTRNSTRLSKEFWLKHAAKLPSLEQARLFHNSIAAFKKMLAEDISFDSDGPRLPMLTKLSLLEVELTSIRVLHLRDTLIERVEQGVPLEYLELRTCVSAKGTIKLLEEIVVDVREPLSVVPRLKAVDARSVM